jgi:hypothetical protein
MLAMGAEGKQKTTNPGALENMLKCHLSMRLSRDMLQRE